MRPTSSGAATSPRLCSPYGLRSLTFPVRESKALRPDGAVAGMRHGPRRETAYRPRPQPALSLHRDARGDGLRASAHAHCAIASITLSHRFLGFAAERPKQHLLGEEERVDVFGGRPGLVDACHHRAAAQNVPTPPFWGISLSKNVPTPRFGAPSCSINGSRHEFSADNRYAVIQNASSEPCCRFQKHAYPGIWDEWLFQNRG